jgi:hypothetical protein
MSPGKTRPFLPNILVVTAVSVGLIVIPHTGAGALSTPRLVRDNTIHPCVLHANFDC